MSTEKPPFDTCPLLLIDVDGVISLFGGSPGDRPDEVLTLVDGVPHRLSREAAGHLAALADLFEPVWCTGWRDRANDHLPGLVGLGPFVTLDFPPGPSAAGHWKLATIDAHVGPDRALAWIDDDLPAACHAWARDREGPTLLVTTDPTEGATAEHADQLRRWAAALRRVPSGP